MKINALKIILLFYFVCVGCKKNINEPSESTNESLFPYKNYSIGDDGNLIFSEMSVDDFQPASDCAECHQTHVNEWEMSPHGRSLTNKFFNNCLNDVKEEYGDEFQKVCFQCHTPANLIATPSISGNSPQVGLSCDICHTMTQTSNGTVTSPDRLVTNKYYLNPGEGIKYGPIENPEPNINHESQYNPIFSQSQICLPCHDLRNEELETEITFTEWNRIPGLAMSGTAPCQQCHMQEKEDGTHSHHFAGVDLSYEVTPEDDPQYENVLELIQTSANLSFQNSDGNLGDSIIRDSILVIPVQVESTNGHDLPSGTSFNRDCWLSIEIRSENSSGEILYQSGVLDHFLQLLNYRDSELTFFTSFLITEDGDTTNDIFKADDIINYSLPGMSKKNVEYSFQMDESINQIWVSAKLLFRPIKPYLFNEYPELQVNIPIYTIDEIEKNIQIIN
ncbi:MAG: hypothetical protein H8E60_07755 [Candidatus Marinimicrobia bacterium]|nr:hypothetical protein [Candidatus Neomarinimicrobiota bacterium]